MSVVWVAHRNKFAIEDLKKIFYKNETNFTFDKYVTKIKGVFNVLEKYNVPLYEDQVFENLLDQIMSPNIELKTEVNICSSSHLSTFVKSSTYLYTVVSIIYPYANPSSGRFRKRVLYATGCGDLGSRRGERFNGRGRSRGRGWRGGRGRGGHVWGGRGVSSSAYENGIDISYFTRYFEDSEWAILSNDTRKRITEDPVLTKFLANKKRHTTSSVSVEKDNKNRFISQIITGVQNESQNGYGLTGGVTPFPTNVRRAQVSAANRGSTSSNINETE